MFDNPHFESAQSGFARLLRSSIQAVACCALLLAFCATANAQTATGQFNGHVTDENGAVVVGAQVTLANSQSGLTRTTTTNGEGFYLFPLLPPGNYKITATQTGFQSAASPDLRLDVNQISSQDFKMSVGQVSETVNVSASAELLQASSTEMGTVVEERTVNELPLNGRNFTSLLTLAPGVNAVNYSQIKSLDYGAGLSAPGLPTATLVSPSVQGQWNRENVYYLDGIINTSAMGGSYDVPPIVDVIQEFKVQSHNDVAEFGGVLGGVVNMVTKSGTNKYHGALWEYVRNNAFDARNPFTDFKGNTPVAPASFRQNEFGGTIGGPVRIPKLYNGTDKTFFFFGYEGWRYSKAAGATYVSPTAAELDGDFTNSSVVNSLGAPALLYDPMSTTGTPGNYTRQLLDDGHHVPASRIDPIAQAFLKNYGDTPNFTPTTPGGANTILNAVGTNNADQYNGRIDQNFGSNNMLWFRYSLMAGANMTPSKFHLANTGSTTNKNYGGGYTHVFSPTLILDARVGYSGRFDAISETKPLGVSAPSGYPGVESVYGHASFGFNGGYSGVGGSGPSGSTLHEFNYAANITWIRGNHQIRFGFQEVVPEMTQGQSGNHFGGASFTFDPEETSSPQNSGSTGNSLASALLGVPHNGRFQSPNNAVRIYSVAAYIQDSWKASPRLTINAGLRWDGESSPRLLIGGAAMMDPNTGNWIISGGKLPPPCDVSKGVFAPCIPSTTPENDAILAAHVVPAENPNLGPDGVYKDFGPRFGVAYKLDSSTVLRAGYGLIYDNLQGGLQTVRDRLLAWPYNASLPLVFNSTGRAVQTMTDITPTLSNTDALPAVSEPFHQSGWYYDPHMKNHYSHQWNVEIQKEIRSNLVGSISYVGSVNGRLPLTGLSNNSREPGDGGVHRPFPWAGSQIMITDRGTANYNSLQTKIEKRMSHGFALGAGYTWSKSMDNGASGFFNTENGPAGGSQVQNYYDLSQNYGLSANSIKHIVYGWALYELPFGKNKPFLNHGVASYLAGGWQANTSLSAHSGPPLTFPDNAADPANVGNTGTQKYARASIKAGVSPKISHPTFKKAFNTDAFESIKNVWGNSGRGIVTGMPFDNVDFSLMKGVSFAEKATLQFRAEFFNVFNIQNYGLPGTTYGGNGFGVITGLAAGSTPRQIQFGLRASF
ncbi:MAG TPA: carboxypeptidase-like regulatory domain-containing protein [Edaphobacter sp.]|nr:carboxypeptidase-like regulatory domain-containing protein [Edaphobacter sp.]